ncbi:MAG: serine/threonine-protein kinase [Planctomycetota bacterium]|nr:serine/threonine-protein kinase [Planctomycetota bacterium]
MATQFDITFFKIAIYNKVTDQATATRCLQYIEQKAQQGQTVSALDAFQSTGADQKIIQQLTTLTQGALKQQGAPSAAPPAASGGPQRRSVTGSQRAPAPLSSSQRAPAPSPRASGRRSQTTAPTETVSGSHVQFGDKIAAGPCGPLYKGVDRASGKDVVLKILSSKFAKHPQYFQQVQSDIKQTVSAGLDNENIVKTHTLFERDARLVVVSDPAKGMTLAEVIKEYGALPPGRAVKLAIQIAKALDHAHSKGVAHGDLRPDKLFVDMKTGILQIGDFGFARASALIHGFARLGVPFGHPYYLAPEIVQQQPSAPTKDQDIYALGIILYELICGKRPFVGGDTKEVLAMHFKAPLPKPPEDIYLHRKLAEVLMKLTAKSPGKRVQSASQAISFLTALSRLDLEASSESAEAGRSDALTGEDWANHSNEAAAPSKEWSEDRIRDASSLEPDEWNPDEEEDDPDLEELAKSRKSARNRRATGSARISKASSRSKTINNDLQNLAEAIAATDVDKTGKVIGKAKASEKKAHAALHAMGKKGAAGNRYQLDGEDRRQEQEKLQKLWGFLIGGSVALFAIVALVIGYSQVMTPKAKLTSTGQAQGKAPESVEQKVVKKPLPLPTAIKQALEKEQDVALRKLKTVVRAKAGKKDWPGAITEIRAFPAHMLRVKGVVAQVQDLTEEVIRKAKGELSSASDKIERFLAANKPGAARSELNKYKDRLISQTFPTFQSLELKIEATAAAISKRPKILDNDTLENWQKQFSKLLFGKYQFRKNKVVVMNYEFNVAGQKRDFGTKDKTILIGPKDNPGLFVKLKRSSSVVLPFAIPIKNFQSCEFSYKYTTGTLTKKSEIAFIFGLDRFTKTKGRKISNTGRLIQFSPGGQVVQYRSKKPTTKFNPWSDKENTVKIVRQGELIVVLINKVRVLKYQSDDVEGYIGLAITDIKARIWNLKIVAQFDPDDVNSYSDAILGKNRRKKPK